MGVPRHRCKPPESKVCVFAAYSMSCYCYLQIPLGMQYKCGISVQLTFRLECESNQLLNQIQF